MVTGLKLLEQRLKMDEELKQAIADYFSPEELIGLLDLTRGEYLELIDNIEDILEDNIDEIKQEMSYEQ